MSSSTDGASGSSPLEPRDEPHPTWVVAILLWTSVGFGAYFFKMLTLPGRLDHLLAHLRDSLTSLPVR